MRGSMFSATKASVSVIVPGHTLNASAMQYGVLGRMKGTTLQVRRHCDVQSLTCTTPSVPEESSFRGISGRTPVQLESRCRDKFLSGGRKRREEIVAAVRDQVRQKRHR